MNPLFTTIAALVATANALIALQPPDTRLPPQAGLEINLSQPYTLTWNHDNTETGNLCIDLVTYVNFCPESARIVINTPIVNDQYTLTLSDIQSKMLTAQTQNGCPNQPQNRPIDRGYALASEYFEPRIRG
ncbi:hypothetical protein BO94DRAFT_581239 [Aspergillus sclerotioniger CBS 115572]|uniref:Uncharacterized protein n=1 Tax=Aspergillus sclerotioniger CBS 115572 TaxID=1450535 RepID=A0A317XG04_9EURO|nr:hypothetical protein BO94DRAFT_581239 [Aspergillus sclerotioniger CBS 115572]PWY96108.1 hypothetical protein BO94DRAFT_581239 [Aspergillus sclerotioniger CBS 115572]